MLSVAEKLPQTAQFLDEFLPAIVIDIFTASLVIDKLNLLVTEESQDGEQVVVVMEVLEFLTLFRGDFSVPDSTQVAQ